MRCERACRPVKYPVGTRRYVPLGQADERGVPAVLVEVARVQTNIVNCYVDHFANDAGEINRALRQRGILALSKRTKIRFVTHYHIDDEAVAAALDAFATVIKSLRKAA